MSCFFTIPTVARSCGQTRTLGLGICIATSIGSARAQPAPSAARPDPGAKQPGKNIVRLDLLSPFGYNMSYNLMADRALVFPVLLSYERHLRGRWSIGAEGLLNGGDPDNRRSGAAVMGRYYVLARKQNPTPMAGWYLSPVVSYRRLNTFLGTNIEDRSIRARAHRLGTGLMVGWQKQLGGTETSGVVLDVAVGGLYAHRVGTDYEGAPGYSASAHAPGVKPDARLGVGYRF